MGGVPLSLEEPVEEALSFPSLFIHLLAVLGFEGG